MPDLARGVGDFVKLVGTRGSESRFTVFKNGRCSEFRCERQEPRRSHRELEFHGLGHVSHDHRDRRGHENKWGRLADFTPRLPRGCTVYYREELDSIILFIQKWYLIKSCHSNSSFSAQHRPLYVRSELFPPHLHDSDECGHGLLLWPCRVIMLAMMCSQSATDSFVAKAYSQQAPFPAGQSTRLMAGSVEFFKVTNCWRKTCKTWRLDVARRRRWFCVPISAPSISERVVSGPHPLFFRVRMDIIRASLIFNHSHSCVQDVVFWPPKLKSSSRSQLHLILL